MKNIVRFTLIALVGAFARTSHATLGESIDSIKADRDANSKTQIRTFSSVKKGNKGPYTYEEYSHPSHRVRQYFANNKVFAVTCSGRSQCDHNVLLGSYAAEFNAELQKARTGRFRGLRAPVQINSEHLMGSSVSNGRIFISKVVLKDAAPVGLNMEDMQ